jgi:hypothetical protein
MSPEWSENLKRLSRLVFNRPRLEQQIGIEATRFQTLCTQSVLDGRVTRQCRWLITAIPIDPSRADLSHQHVQFTQRRTSPQDNR